MMVLLAVSENSTDAAVRARPRNPNSEHVRLQRQKLFPETPDHSMWGTDCFETSCSMLSNKSSTIDRSNSEWHFSV